MEWPSSRSVTFPSRKGTLNFFDDPSHCRQYSFVELRDLLEAESFELIEFGTRRQAVTILLIPLNALRHKVEDGYVPGSVFWDLLGFAEFIFARRRMV